MKLTKAQAKALAWFASAGKTTICPTWIRTPTINCLVGSGMVCRSSGIGSFIEFEASPAGLSALAEQEKANA